MPLMTRIMGVPVYIKSKRVYDRFNEADCVHHTEQCHGEQITTSNEADINEWVGDLTRLEIWTIQNWLLTNFGVNLPDSTLYVTVEDFTDLIRVHVNYAYAQAAINGANQEHLLRRLENWRARLAYEGYSDPVPIRLYPTIKFGE